jgi:hypothetical protein
MNAFALPDSAFRWKPVVPHDRGPEIAAWQPRSPDAPTPEVAKSATKLDLN